MKAEGRLADVITYLEALQHATASDAFLVIEVHGTDAFLQLIPTPSSLELDFPILTTRQRSLEAKVRGIAASRSLEVRTTKGSDGSVFIDIDIAASSAQAAEIVRSFLGELYGVRPETSLLFELNATNNVTSDR